MTKFFSRPNLATDRVEVIEKPWEISLPGEIMDLPKDEYKRRWLSPETQHFLLMLSQGQNEDYCVSVGNQASLLYGFFADYDGVLTPDLIDSLKAKRQAKYKPAWWCLSHSGKLHLVWLFERPVTVTGNVHANKLLSIIAKKVKAAHWGVGYDPSCEEVTQVMDIGREWHVFEEDARIPTAEILAWDLTLFEASVRNMVSDAVDIDIQTVAAEVKKRTWPQQPPASFVIGARCVRFWDPTADNSTGAQVVKDGIRVYTPHDNGFKSWRSLLGAEFCEAYTAKSMAPFLEDTYYCHNKDEYWRFFRTDNVPHYEKRTEKVLRRDLIKEARLSSKPAKGEDLSELDQMLYTISRKNTVDVVAPILYRPSGGIHVPELGAVLNTSLVTVQKPANRLSDLSVGDLADYPDCPEEYRDDPSICAWDNPFAVKGFPHIHRLLTVLFMKSQNAYDSWCNAGFPLHGSDGSAVPFLSDMQLTYLLSWLAHFYTNAARMSQNPGRGQVLILAGPAGIGKSFFATEILGGLAGGWTYADKMYLEGSRFNASTVEYPVHVIDDKLGSRSQRDRLKFTEALKVVAANARVRCEAKFGASTENVPWPGRVVILSNEDAQSLSVLPDLDMSTRDKFMMLKLGGAKFHWGTDSENQKWLADELPYFARFLLGWTIPVQMRDRRFGVRAIQHSDMAQASAENGLTQVLVEVLETCIETVTGGIDAADRGDTEGWAIEGNAVKIFKWIRSVDDSLAREVIDSRTLQQSLTTLFKNGGYNIEQDPYTKWWKIPYVLRKKIDNNG